MENLNKARTILEEEKMSLVLVNAGKVIYKSSEKSISPMLELYSNYKDQARGGAIADLVIGRGAALLAKDLKIKSLYAKLISEGALNVLDNVGILYDNQVEYILNRDQTDLCPIEKMAQDLEDGHEMSKKIKEFLDNE